jgi:hypothetical protein
MNGINFKLSFMKKIFFCFLAVCTIITSSGVGVYAATVPEKLQTVNDRAEVQKLTNRLTEISFIDRSKLTSGERRALRKEVRTIDHRLHAIGGGIYISAGALIIILLLILIL